jgi:hypothetical protein
MLAGVFVAAATANLLIFVCDSRVDAVAQSGLRIGGGCLRSEPSEQVGIEDAAVEIEPPVRRVAAAVPLVGVDARPASPCARSLDPMRLLGMPSSSMRIATCQSSGSA